MIKYAGVGACHICRGGGKFDGFQGLYSGKVADFEKSRSMNGVAMRDGELILWGMKAMA